MDFKEILASAQSYIASYFKQSESANFLYHNYDHTLAVVNATTQLSAYYKLSEPDNFIVQAAAWFHDMGYFVDPNDHENKSISLCENFLKEQDVDQEIIAQVKGCINATKIPQKPQGLLQQIVCDADLSHFASDSFQEKSKQLRKEMQLRCGMAISKNAWRNQTICLLEAHQYYTDYAKNNWSSKKAENLETLQKKDNGNAEAEEIEDGAATKKNKKGNTERPDKGIETMFRITSTNNQRLSDMADKKADILITVNSILLSAILSLLIRKLEGNTHLVVPTIIILIVSAVTLTYAILATRPNIPNGTFTQKEVDDRSVNLLFFGNFYKMNFDEYKNGMWRVMNDRDFLYGSLVKDVYSQGIVLGRKYRLLRIAYNVFMFGLIVSILAFMIAILSVV